MTPTLNKAPFEVCVYRVMADDRVDTQVVRSLDELGSALVDGWATTVEAARQLAATQQPEPAAEPADDPAPVSHSEPDVDPNAAEQAESSDATGPAADKPKRKAAKKK